MHPHRHAAHFAKELVVRTTRLGHALLGFAGGEIAEGAPATFQLVSIPKDLAKKEDIYLHLILHTQKPQTLYIEGERYGE